MFNFEDLIDRFLNVPWQDLGKTAFSALSCLTVMFAFYVLYFDRGVFAFISAFSYLNFLFFTSILLTVSFGLARLSLFLFEHYLVPLIESVSLLLVSILAIFFAKLGARVQLKLIKRVGVQVLQSGDAVKSTIDSLRNLSKNPLSPFVLGSLIFLLVYLENVMPSGVAALLMIFFTGYFVYCLNVAYGAPYIPESDGPRDQVDQSLVSILRETAGDLLSAQREFTDGLSRSILLGQKLSDIYPVLFNTKNVRVYLLKFWGLIAVVASAALGYYRGEVAENSSLYFVTMPAAVTEGFSDNLEVAVFLTTSSAVLAKDLNTGEILVLPFDAIGVLRTQGSNFTSFTGFSGGGGF